VLFLRVRILAGTEEERPLQVHDGRGSRVQFWRGRVFIYGRRLRTSVLQMQNGDMDCFVIGHAVMLRLGMARSID
jgi:hypothetical protein